MANRVQISCINKRPDHHDPHTRIQAVGGVHNGKRWNLGEDQAIRDTLAGKYQFFVAVNGRSVDVVVAEHLHRKYLKTTADDYAPNNLLSLSECSL